MGSFKAPKPTQKPTQKPTTQKPTTKKATDKVPDDLFFALLNSIKEEKNVKTTKALKSDSQKKKLKKQKPDEMRFALNVDEDGNVHKTYQKMAEKKNSEVADERFFGVMGGLKTTAATTTTTMKATTSVATAQKAGPLAHLPPWQQRKIRLQRKKLLEEQVANGNRAAKIQLDKLLKIIEQDKLEVAKNQKIAGNRAVSTTTEMPKLSKKEKKEKSSKAKKAQPQMMKFSQWATSDAPEVEIIELETNPEDQVITVTSDLSDEEFSKMLKNMEPENLFEKKEVSDDEFFSMIDFLG